MGLEYVYDGLREGRLTYAPGQSIERVGNNRTVPQHVVPIQSQRKLRDLEDL